MATLPATTPQAFAAYLNAHFKGDNQKLGGTVAALGLPGATLGDQWLSWYASKTSQKTTSTQKNDTHTLLQYEEAFVLLWEDAMLGGNLAAATTGGLSTAGNFANQGVAGVNNFYNSTLFGGLTKLVGDIESSAFWLRAAKVLIGGTLLLVGIAHMTGADNAVAKAARSVPIPV